MENNECKSCGGELIYKDYFAEESESGELITGNIYECFDCKDMVTVLDSEILVTA